jgi:NADH dehydrogenase
MAGDLIVVFGGSGFIGRHVVKALARAGKRVRVAVRRPHLAYDLRVLGDVGQIQLVQANVRYPESVARALEGADGVVNLVGILYERGKQSFFDIQEEGAATIAAHAAKLGVKRFVQMSAIGADPKAHARYARTKGEAEESVRAALPEAVIMRPSIVFGPEDDFFNRFANMAKFAPVLPSIGFGAAKFQPVYVGDVARAIVAALDDPNARGRTYELGGPRVYSFKQVLRYVCREIDRPRPLFPLPFFVAHPLGMIIGAAWRLPLAHEILGPPPITADQVELLKKPNIVSPGANTLADLGVAAPESVEAIVPTYLWRFRPYGQFQTKQAAG